MDKKSAVYHGGTKHITVKHHLIRKIVKEEEVNLEFCKFSDQHADVLVKVLPSKYKRTLKSLRRTN